MKHFLYLCSTPTSVMNTKTRRQVTEFKLLSKKSRTEKMILENVS